MKEEPNYALLGEIISRLTDISHHWKIVLKVMQRLNGENSDEKLFVELLEHSLSTENEWIEEKGVVTPLWGHGSDVARTFRIVRSYHYYLDQDYGTRFLDWNLATLADELFLQAFSSDDIKQLTSQTLDSCPNRFYELGIYRAIFVTNQKDDRVLIYENKNGFKKLLRVLKKEVCINQGDVFVFLAK